MTERRAFVVLAIGLAALAAGVALIVVSRTGGGAETARATAPGTSETAALLDGIQQAGVVLGDPGAPVTLVEWADLQCPFCREWSTNAFPELVRDYVRAGKLQIVFRGLAFLGPDSGRALRTALAAGLHNRLWNVVDLLYRNQGPENSGWATDELLRSVAASVDGLDPARTIDESGSTQVQTAIDQVARAGDAAHVTRTPTFDLGKTGSKRFQRLNPPTLTAAAFRPAVERLLAG